MTDPATTVANFRHAVSVLADAGDPSLAQVADVLARWLAGEDFEAAAALAPGWRRRLQDETRDIALSALIRLHPDLDDSALALEIASGIAQASCSGPRPDGAAAGHYHDLARADRGLSDRRWRYLIAEVRGRLASVSATDAFRVWSGSKLET